MPSSCVCCRCGDSSEDPYWRGTAICSDAAQIQNTVCKKEKLFLISWGLQQSTSPVRVLLRHDCRQRRDEIIPSPRILRVCACVYAYSRWSLGEQFGAAWSLTVVVHNSNSSGATVFIFFSVLWRSYYAVAPVDGISWVRIPVKGIFHFFVSSSVLDE